MTTSANQEGDAMNATLCRKCGERFRRESESYFHTCTAIDNRTGLQPGDTVRAGGAIGQVHRLYVRGTAGTVEVYFRSSFRTYSYPADQVERVAS
jgi:hypothetical protein